MTTAEMIVEDYVRAIDSDKDVLRVTPEMVCATDSPLFGEVSAALMAEQEKYRASLDEQQDSTERELVDMMSRLIRAAADVRGHSPSRANAHGNCVHCAATRQATAFVRAMQSDDGTEIEESRIVRP